MRNSRCFLLKKAKKWSLYFCRLLKIRQTITFKIENPKNKYESKLYGSTTFYQDSEISVYINILKCGSLIDLKQTIFHELLHVKLYIIGKSLKKNKKQAGRLEEEFIRCLEKLIK
jgi:predicted SprT family Zn-dependent metalloprotease